MDDRALSLVQPWLSGGILRFGKRIENRVGWRACKYRGPIWLHASATKGRAFDEACGGLADVLVAQGRRREWMDYETMHTQTRGMMFRPRPTLPMGAIVGRANIVDVIRDQVDWSVLCRERRSPVTPEQYPWWFGGFALVLDNVVEIAPVPAKGALGLWRVPEQIAADAMSAYRAAVYRRARDAYAAEGSTMGGPFSG